MTARKRDHAPAVRRKQTAVNLRHRQLPAAGSRRQATIDPNLLAK